MQTAQTQSQDAGKCSSARTKHRDSCQTQSHSFTASHRASATTTRSHGPRRRPVSRPERGSETVLSANPRRCSHSQTDSNDLNLAAEAWQPRASSETSGLWTIIISQLTINADQVVLCVDGYSQGSMGD